MDTHQTRFDIDFFISKFSAIPDERWCEADFNNKLGQSCALGHCGVLRSSELMFDGETDIVAVHPSRAEGRALWEILRCNIGSVNNGGNPRYQQPTPRARILAALHDAKAKAEAALEAYEDRPLTLTPKPVEAV